MAIKKIMVLSGVANAGKTNTLNRLAERLFASHHLLWIGKPNRNAIIATQGTAIMPTGPQWRDTDYWYCFQVTTRSNKQVVVAISTQGDNDEVCKNALAAFNSAQTCPEIVVLAARSRWSDSVAEIENWNSSIIPSYTAIMLEPNTKQRTVVENAIVDRLYGEIV